MPDALIACNCCGYYAAMAVLEPHWDSCSGCSVSSLVFLLWAERAGGVVH